MTDPRAYPARPIVAVGGIVWKGDDVLLIRRARPPRAGEWSLPGGAQETGETLEEALHREIREETGIEMQVVSLLTVVDAIFPDEEGRARHHYTLIDYTCLWEAGEPRPGGDEKEALWISPQRLEMLALWSKTREVIAQSREQVRTLQGGL